MTQIHKSLLRTLSVAAYCCALGFQPALAQSTAEPTSVAKPSDLYSRDPRAVDHYVPVITMEQVRASHTVLQAYRVQIFKNGSVIYHGLKDVKTVGEVRFNIKPEQAQRLLDEFSKYKFWNIPEDQYGEPAAVEPVHLVFTVREGHKVKTVRFGSQNHGILLKRIVEDEVRTRMWRCPYVNEMALDLCAAEDRYATETAIPNFLKSTWPRLQEAYK